MGPAVIVLSSKSLTLCCFCLQEANVPNTVFAANTKHLANVVPHRLSACSTVSDSQGAQGWVSGKNLCIVIACIIVLSNLTGRWWNVLTNLKPEKLPH